MNWKLWAKAAAIRTVKTMAEAALSLLTVGQYFFQIDWKSVSSVSLVAGVIALLTCIKGLPEVDQQTQIVRYDDDRSDDAPNYGEE